MSFYTQSLQQRIIYAPISAPLPWNQEVIQLSRELIAISQQVKRLQERLSSVSTSCERLEVAKDRAESRAEVCEQMLQVREVELQEATEHIQELQSALREVVKVNNDQNRYIDTLHKKIAGFPERKERGAFGRPAVMWKPKPNRNK